MAAEERLLSDVEARNPGLGRAGIEKVLAETHGNRRVIGLGRGIAGDDTHGLRRPRVGLETVHSATQQEP